MMKIQTDSRRGMFSAVKTSRKPMIEINNLRKSFGAQEDINWRMCLLSFIRVKILLCWANPGSGKCSSDKMHGRLAGS